jgi:DNA-binding HxlR family transcriptional regulator
MARGPPSATFVPGPVQILYWKRLSDPCDTQVVATYEEYCPIAVGVEYFGDRWTPLILRELVVGSHRFNEIHRGIPKISRTLLSQRLRSLVERGLVERVDDDGIEYHLTPAGADLQPIIWALGHWAARWAFGDPDKAQLDVALLVWRMRQHLDPERLPARRTTVEFRASGHNGGRAWLVADRRGSTACLTDPGYEVDLVVHASNTALHQWFVGRAELRQEVQAGRIRFNGPTRLVRSFPTWFIADPMLDEVRRYARAERVS